MSTILTYIVTALGGVLAGFALAGSLLWHQQQALTRARHDATHDDTTGLLNRRALTGALRQALTRGTPCDWSCSTSTISKPSTTPLATK